MISDIVARRLKLKISPTHSGAHQVDRSKLKVLGSVCVNLQYKENEFTYDALVCKDVGEILLCWIPFLEQEIIPNPVDKCIEVRSQQVDKVVIDPDNILTQSQKSEFKKTLEKLKEVFSSMAGRYNGVLGNLNSQNYTE